MADEVFVKIAPIIFTLQWLILMEKVTLEWLPCEIIGLNQAEPIWNKHNIPHSSDREFICFFPSWNKLTTKLCAVYVGHTVDVLPTAASCKNSFVNTEELWQSPCTGVICPECNAKNAGCFFPARAVSENQLNRCLSHPQDLVLCSKTPFQSPAAPLASDMLGHNKTRCHYHFSGRVWV